MEWNNPFPNDKIVDTSKLKEFADDNFTFDKSDRKFSERIESTVGKGEIARYEQFLLFPPWFQKICTVDTLKPGLVWEWIKSLSTNAFNSEPLQDNQSSTIFEHIFFHFNSKTKQISISHPHSFCRLQTLSISISPKFCHLLKSQGLKTFSLLLSVISQFKSNITPDWLNHLAVPLRLLHRTI